MTRHDSTLICALLAALLAAGCGDDDTGHDADGGLPDGAHPDAATPDAEVQPPFDEAHYYVATDGDDANPGTLDLPFATLERARLAVRDHKASEGIPDGGLVVALRGGVYERTQTFTLDAEDSGEPDRPVWWVAYPNETVRLTGAAALEPGWFTPADSGDPLWDRLDATARDQIVVADLGAHGLTDYGTLAHRGFSTGNVHAPLELFVDGAPLELARWPNRGQTDPEDPTADAEVSGDLFGASTLFAYTGTTATGNADDGYANFAANVGGTDYHLYHCTWEWGGATHRYWFISTHDPVTDPACWPDSDTSWLVSGEWPIPPLQPFGGAATAIVIARTRPVDFAEHGFLRTPDALSNTSFTFPGTRHQRWTQADDLWFQGLFEHLWADDTLPGAIDAGGTVTLTEDPAYGLLPFRPFFVLNLAEELDTPGEWWLDRSAGRLYLYPLAPLGNADIAVSLLDDPLLDVTDASHLRFVDLTFEHARGNLALAAGVADVVFRGVTFRGSGADAVRLSGTDSGLDRCLVTDSGGAAVQLTGGDRPTLTPGHLFVRQTELARFGRWDRTYKVGVRIYGCGNEVTHNHFHDAPHTAILYNGNDHRIEYNRIERVVLEASDAGAIYTGRDWGYRGNLIRFNLIRDLESVFGGVVGVYLDDASSGMTVYGNIIYNVNGLGTQSGGGRNNHFENNIIVDAKSAAHSTDRRANTCNYDFDGNGRPDSWNLLGRINWVFETWWSGPQAIAYQDDPWATRFPELAAIPNDWGQVQAGTWRDPEGCIFANNVVWRAGGLISVGTWGGDNATDFYTAIDPNLEADPLFVDEAGGDLSLQPTSPAYNTPGFTFQPIPFDQIGIQ
jgi:hypothetical protein